MPILNARMYGATPALRDDWRTLLHWVQARAGLSRAAGWEVIDYDAPAPLSALWARPDLGAVMMCGLPFARQRDRVQIIAAPVPSAPRFGGRPVYFTDLVVRSDSPAVSLEDTFGGVVGTTVADSMSGCIALKAHLREQAGARARYRRVVGGLVNARGVIEALAAGRIDVGPLDGWYHDLLRHNDPAFAAQVRTIATTRAWPIPAFVAATSIEPDVVIRLREALLAAADAPELVTPLARLLLAGFCVPDPDSYDVLSVLADGVADFMEDVT
ncbi:MAG: phosphate/phosphite/phosphonate ABC transporter substrate-binding protein [Lautropia sp.]